MYSIAAYLPSPRALMEGLYNIPITIYGYPFAIPLVVTYITLNLTLAFLGQS